MSTKQTRTEKLKADIDIRDKLIALLIKEIAKRQIVLPKYLIDIIENVYNLEYKNKIEEVKINE
jgi:hypothetical protein